MLAWRWLFIIEGTATILMAIAAMFILPNWPHNTSWLSAEEKEMARYRSVKIQPQSTFRGPTLTYFLGLHTRLPEEPMTRMIHRSRALSRPYRTPKSGSWSSCNMRSWLA